MCNGFEKNGIQDRSFQQFFYCRGITPNGLAPEKAASICTNHTLLTLLATSHIPVEDSM